MKGLLKTFGIMALLIIAGLISSVIVASNLNDRLAAAYEEGYDRAYLDGIQEGSRAGYQEGSKTGYAKANQKDSGVSNEEGFYFLYNPTYDEVYEILAEAKTGTVREIHDYAVINGIRTAYVRAQLARKAPEGMVYIYELVAFETIDRGLIIVEPWSHQETKVEVGRSYQELNGLPLPSHDDTITKITIVW